MIMSSQLYMCQVKYTSYRHPARFALAIAIALALTLRRKLSNLATLNMDGSTTLSNALLSTKTNDFPSELQDTIP